jgi:Domain of unknown function (DUF4190)
MQSEPIIQPRKGFAVASLVFGLVSIPTCGMLGLGSLAGIVLGIVALVKISKRPNEYTGKGMAIGGIVTSAVAILLIAPIVAALALPKLNEALKTGRETVAVTLLRTVHNAEAQYQAMHGKFGTLQELAGEGLIDKKLFGAEAVGDYRYSDSEVSDKTYCVHATRASDAVARRDFNVSEDGEVRFVEAKTHAVVPRGGGTPLSK